MMSLMNNAVTKARIENVIAYWRSLKTRNAAERGLVARTVAELEGRLAAL